LKELISIVIRSGEKTSQNLVSAFCVETNTRWDCLVFGSFIEEKILGQIDHDFFCWYCILIYVKDSNLAVSSSLAHHPIFI